MIRKDRIEPIRPRARHYRLVFGMRGRAAGPQLDPQLVAEHRQSSSSVTSLFLRDLCGSIPQCLSLRLALSRFL
jgi:hypothetical protein